MNAIVVGSSLAVCVGLSTFAPSQEFPRLKQPMTFGLGGGFIGGQQDDESASVWNRILSFDYENSYIPQLNRYLQDRASVFGDQPISDKVKRLLDELIVERINLHGKNMDELSALLKYERSQAITRSEEPPEAKEILRKVLSIPTDTPQPTVNEINEAFLRYKKGEIAAEKEFAE